MARGDVSDYPRARRSTAATILIVVGVLILLCCLCACFAILVVPRTSAQVLCQISPDFCAGYCRESPGNCAELQLTPAAP